MVGSLYARFRCVVCVCLCFCVCVRVCGMTHLEIAAEMIQQKLFSNYKQFSYTDEEYVCSHISVFSLPT